MEYNCLKNFPFEKKMENDLNMVKANQTLFNKTYPDFVKIYKLSNENYIPSIGLGTYQMSNNKEIEESVCAAYEAGYRHIDSAIMYANEKTIGNALEKYNIPRDDIFITTKIPPEGMTAQKTLELVKQSIKNFSTDYLDLVLIHWPRVQKLEQRLEVWQTLEKCVSDGLIRSIGVSNFTPKHFKIILDNCKIKPVVNQIETHPLYIDWETIEFCRNENILIEAYCPFAQFDSKLIKNKTLTAISKAKNLSPAQVLVRWSLQHGFVVLPKSRRREKVFENFDVNHFELTEEEMKALDELNCGYKIDWDPRSVN